MKQFRLLGLVCATASLAVAAHAQFDFGGGGGDSSPPAPAAAAWASFHLNPKTRVTLDFRNASPDAVLHYLSRTSGIAIVKDPNFKTPLTLQSPHSQSLNDAFEMLNAVLGLSNYELGKEGNFLIVRAKQGGGGRGGRGGFGAGGFSGFSGFGGGGGGRSSSLQLKVYKLQYASASSVAKVINDVFAPNPQQQQQNNGFPNFGGFGGNQGGGFGGRRGRGGGGGSTDNSTTIPTVKASADDYSNSLIVNAPNRQQDEVADILAQIDKPTDQPMHPRVFKLNYAVASDVQPVVQSLLQASTPLGRGNSGTSQQPQFGRGGFGGPGGFFRAMMASQSQSTAGGTVVADSRSNSLIVTTTEESLDTVDKVIKQLDVPAVYADTTFVYPLKNARADVVANLLNESFGNRTTNGPTGGSLTNTGPSQGSISSTTTAASLSSSTPGGGNNGGNRNNGYNMFGQQSTTSSNNSSLADLTTSLDSEGHVVNVRSLSGQVLLVPNIDTNSIIVVAPPNLQQVVKNVLDQMDELPAQVMIEAVIMEADLNKQNQFGVEWNLSNFKLFGAKNTLGNLGTDFGLHNPPNGAGATSTNGTNGAPGAALEKGFTYAMTAGQATAFIDAVAKDTKSNVLSTPRILTTNNATAQINISESVPYVSSQTTDTNGVIISNYNFLNVGVILTVTPRITSGGFVTMDVSQTANTLLGFINTAPEVDQRESQSTVSIKDGETIVLGGIIQDNVSKTVNKVPILGDLPLLGNLFKSTDKEKGKTELLVFLTPHIIRTPTDARTVRQMTTDEMDGDMRKQVVDTIKTQPTTPAAPPSDSGSTGAPNNGGVGASTTPTGMPMHVTTTILAPGAAPATLPPTVPGGTITTPAGTAPPASTAPTANQAVQPKILPGPQPGVTPPAQPASPPGTVTPGQ